MTPSPPWTGFLRLPGARWSAVCQAATWAECWARLLPIRPADAASVEKLVSQRNPNERKGRPR